MGVTGEQDSASDNYPFDRGWPAEFERLRLLESEYDDLSQFACISAGLRPTFRCLDVGAGGGSMARWLSKQVADAKQVTALDSHVDTNLLSEANSSGLDVVSADATNFEFGCEQFDLIHIRFLLVHLASRNDLLNKLAKALTRNGAIVAVESSYSSWQVPIEYVELSQVKQAYLDAMARQVGWPLELGDELPARLRSAGLEVTSSLGKRAFCSSGNNVSRLVSLSLQSQRSRFVGELNDIDQGTFEAAIASLHDHAFAAPFVTTWASIAKRTGDI